MIKVIGVRFRTAGKIYFFDPLQFEIKKGDHVIVETARGIEFGTVVTGKTEVEDEKVVQPLKPVIRIANQRDMEQEAANRDKEKDAFRICLEKIREHKLEMKLIDAEYTFDNNKVLFYFTADGRIDFRELVKDLASVFKTRIELRQIGVRDETKIVGGIGICGRALCCHSYLSDFVPVSIKMAKEQNLSLNPAKISGMCGRLMCCLKNEEETYEELNRRLPGIGDFVTTDDGLRGEVHSVNVLRQLVKVIVDAGDEKEIKEFPVEKLHFRRKHTKKERMELSKEELEELERLEEEEQQEESAKTEEEQQRQTRSRQGGRRQPGQDSRRQSRQNGEGEKKQQSQYPDEKKQSGEDGRRQSGQDNRNRQGGRRQSGQRPGGGQNQQGQRGEGDQAHAERHPADGQHAEGKENRAEQQVNQRHGGRNRRDNRRRQDRNRQEGQQRQESSENQGGRNHYDNRDGQDGGAGQGN